MKTKRIISLVFLSSLVTVFLVIIRVRLKANGNDFIGEYQYPGDKILEVNVVGTESDGDCIIIRYDNTQILIDTLSSSKHNFEMIHKKMEEYMTGEDEKKWDYIIFTHPHEDHMGNANKILQLFKDNDTWTLGTVIDYDFKEASDDFFKTNNSDENYYADYRELRNELVSKYKVNYFSAAELDTMNKVKTFSLENDVYLHVLYNYSDNYAEITRNGVKSISGYQNLVSVCCLVEFKEQKLLFTGDLEEDGEVELVVNHRDLLEGVTFFKAGHHGSSATSNTINFIDCIRPEYVAITKMGAASDPDCSINNFLKYTDYIYPTYVKNNNKLYCLFGDERFLFNGKKVKVLSSNKNNIDSFTSEAVSLFDAILDDGTNWFYEGVAGSGSIEDNLYIYTFDEGLPSYNNCTLIKYGHYDILVDCGSLDYYSREYVSKLKKYVVDGVIEYVIITQNQVPNMRQMVSTSNYSNHGVFDEFEIEYLYDSGRTNNSKDEGKYSHYVRYLNQTNKVKKEYISLNVNGEVKKRIADNLKLSVWGSSVSYSPNENDYSMCVLIQFYNEKYLFVGDLTNYDYLLKSHKTDLMNVKFFRLSNAATRIDKMEKFQEFINYITPDISVIGTPLHFVMSNGKEMFDKHDLNTLRNITGFKDIYYCSYLDEEGNYSLGNGSLVFIASNKIRVKDYIVKESTSSDRTIKPDTIETYYKRVY